MLIEGNLHAAPPIGLASFRIDARSTRISLGPTRYAVSRPWEIQRRIVLTSTSKYSAVFLMSGLGGSCAGVITVCGCLTSGRTWIARCGESGDVYAITEVTLVDRTQKSRRWEKFCYGPRRPGSAVSRMLIARHPYKEKSQRGLITTSDLWGE